MTHEEKEKEIEAALKEMIRAAVLENEEILLGPKSFAKMLLQASNFLFILAEGFIRAHLDAQQEENPSEEG